MNHRSQGYDYALAEWGLRSDWRLPLPPAPAATPLGLRLRRARPHPVPAAARDLGELPAVRAAGMANRCHTHGDDTWFNFAGVGEMQVVGGAEIRVRLAPGARIAALRHWLAHMVVPTALCRAGCLALHAGAVRLGDRAALFLGDSGAGKSSLVTALALAGLPLISDDTCLLTTPPWRVFSTSPTARLLPEAVARLALACARVPADLPGLAKTVVRVPHVAAGVPLPLAAIYLLAWHDGPPVLSPARGVERLGAVLQAAAWVNSDATPAASREHFARCEAIARSLPVWRLARPRDWSQMPRVCELLRRQVASG